MIRNLKALGLAVVAVLAMGAFATSAAQAANGVITADTYPATLEGTGNVDDTFHAFGTNVQCPEGSHYKGTLAAASSTVTVTPEYTASHATPCLAGGLRATVTHNGCNLVFHVGETTGVGEDTYGVTTDITCPVGKVIEVHVYASTANHVSGTALCTITVGPQTGIKGLHATSMTVPNPKDLTLSGNTEKTIHATIHRNSILCPKGETSDPVTGASTTTDEAQFTIASPITIEATNAAGAKINTEIHDK